MIALFNKNSKEANTVSVKWVWAGQTKDTDKDWALSAPYWHWQTAFH